MNELELKLARLYDLMETKNVDALCLSRASSFAWIAGGASSYINTASDYGAAQVLITKDQRSILTTNIEAPRIGGEEGLAAAGWEIVAEPWYEAPKALADRTADLTVGSDDGSIGLDLGGEVGWLRTLLTPPEIDRFRTLGARCAEAMNAAIRNVRPGMFEHEIAAILAKEAQQRGVQAIVNLIATDERIFNYRHPLPANKQMEKYAMLVLCGRRQGEVCSITRLIHYGPLSDELRLKMEAVALIDATTVVKTRPGRTLGDVFSDIQQAYDATGFADEWQLHHQGGPAGYEPREAIAMPGAPQVVAAGQTYAWNPSITGAKSEDTILIGEEKNEVLTTIEGWPMIDVEIDGQVVPRPAILEM
jgi:Xaa-Pro aminopeptidase